MTATSYPEEIRQYQAKMERQLRAPDGWLTLAGLHWLTPGNNTLGSALSSNIPLPPFSAPQEVGNLIFDQGKVSFQPFSGVDIRINGHAVNTPIDLEPDRNQNPTILTLGDLSIFVIIRGERVGIRVKQVSHPNRLNFPGRVWWPVDESFRVQAEVKVYEPQKIISIPDILGDIEETPVDCALQFSLDHQTYTLDPITLTSGQFYILFHDLSCGQGSYPSGRFLVTEPPEGGTVWIDFNKAYNPPCAFTPYATCPMPPKQNYLPASIHAGERYQNHSGDLAVK
ncbi:MAG TPA: DUF1684 domain-containing protein [Chloroflexi bacterium]|nr:DUF1684 domain-containing protein [Chloroflexota bacterium]